MLDQVLPNLSLTGIPLGPTTRPKDLRWFLYAGTDLNWKHFIKAYDAGELGLPLLERLPLLISIHRRWQSGLSDGSFAAASLGREWHTLRFLLRFSESAQIPFTEEGALNLYLAWVESLKKRGDLKGQTKYDYSIDGARVLASALGLDAKRIQWRTKVRRPKKLGTKSSKENLEQTAHFIQCLLETTEQLSLESIRGRLPVSLVFEKGKTYQIHCGRALSPIDSLATSANPWFRQFAEAARERRDQDSSNKKRAPLINLRIEAELLVFINQTGSNLTQALRLTGSKFTYQSDGDYLRLFVWKNRAKHDVELRIHKAYRHHFEAYLAWRSSVFPKDRDGLTFPFVRNHGELTMKRSTWSFEYTHKLMREIDEPFVPATQLRKTIGNFVKRNSSRQEAAALLSNTQQTFASHYEEVNHQRGVAELTAFWNDVEQVVLAVGPGGCRGGAPQLSDEAPATAPVPDCADSGGCMFCSENRDIDSFDHVWNLASLHHLKLSELNADRTPQGLKANGRVALQAERAARKIDAFAKLGGHRAAWVVEARLRVDEGRYHPFYAAKFELLEGIA